MYNMSIISCGKNNPGKEKEKKKGEGHREAEQTQKLTVVVGMPRKWLLEGAMLYCFPNATKTPDNSRGADADASEEGSEEDEAEEEDDG